MNILKTMEEYAKVLSASETPLNNNPIVIYLKPKEFQELRREIKNSARSFMKYAYMEDSKICIKNLEIRTR